MLKEADLILTLTEKHKQILEEFEATNGKQILTIKEFGGGKGDVEDPSMKDLRGFREARDEIKTYLKRGLKKHFGDRVDEWSSGME